MRRSTLRSLVVIAVVVALGVGRAGAAPTVVSTTQTEVTIGGLTCGTQYRLRVSVAGNSKGTTLNAVTQPCSPPPPPPPPANAYVYDDFCDGTTPWTKNVVNRWNTEPVGTDPFYACTDDFGTPWADGIGEVTENVSTPYGPGFKMVITNNMDVSSGGRRGEMHDYAHAGDFGDKQVWRGHLMLPSQSFAPNTDWNVLWELKPDNNMGGSALGGIGLDGSNERCAGPCLYVSNIPCGVAQNCRHRLTGPVIVPGHWYSWEYRVRWTDQADGYFEAYIDGVKLGRFDGATDLGRGGPVLQFGFYGALHSDPNTVFHGPVSVEKVP